MHLINKVSLVVALIAAPLAACASLRTSGEMSANTVAAASPIVNSNPTGSASPNATPQHATTSENMNTNYADALPGLDFAADISVTPAKPGYVGDGLRINYKVTNRTGKPVLVFNQGDTNNPGAQGAVYVQPQANGIVEISKRGWLPPSEPSPTGLVYPGALLLAPGESTSEKIEMSVALMTARHPYRSMTPGAAMPRPVRRVRFCLGVVPAEGIETRTAGEGARRILVPDYKAIATQRLLCSSVQDIQ